MSSHWAWAVPPAAESKGEHPVFPQAWGLHPLGICFLHRGNKVQELHPPEAAQPIPTESTLAASPITLQSRRRLVVSPSPLSRGLSFQDGGSGIRRPMGRWNFLRRGSTVTMGLKVAWFPSSLVTNSSGTGCACGEHKDGHQGWCFPRLGHSLGLQKHVWAPGQAL